MPTRVHVPRGLLLHPVHSLPLPQHLHMAPEHSWCSVNSCPLLFYGCSENDFSIFLASNLRAFSDLTWPSISHSRGPQSFKSIYFFPHQHIKPSLLSSFIHCALYFISMRSYPGLANSRMHYDSCLSPCTSFLLPWTGVLLGPCFPILYLLLIFLFSTKLLTIMLLRPLI